MQTTETDICSVSVYKFQKVLALYPLWFSKFSPLFLYYVVHFIVTLFMSLHISEGQILTKCMTQQILILLRCFFLSQAVPSVLINMQFHLLPCMLIMGSEPWASFLLRMRSTAELLLYCILHLQREGSCDKQVREPAESMLTVQTQAWWGSVSYFMFMSRISTIFLCHAFC